MRLNAENKKVVLPKRGYYMPKPEDYYEETIINYDDEESVPNKNQKGIWPDKPPLVTNEE